MNEPEDEFDRRFPEPFLSVHVRVRHDERCWSFLIHCPQYEGETRYVLHVNPEGDEPEDLWQWPLLRVIRDDEGVGLVRRIQGLQVPVLPQEPGWMGRGAVDHWELRLENGRNCSHFEWSREAPDEWKEVYSLGRAVLAIAKFHCPGLGGPWGWW